MVFLPGLEALITEFEILDEESENRMDKFWRGLARVVAVILTIFFVVTMVVSILLYSMDSSLLSARTYKSVMVGQQVYLRLPRILAEQLTISMVVNVCQDNPFLCENITPEFKECVTQAIGQTRFDALAPGEDIPTTLEKELIEPCVDQFLPQASGNAAKSGTPEFMKILTVANWETILSTLFPSNELRTMTEDLIDQTFVYLNGQQDTVSISLGELKRSIAGQPGVDAMLELIRAQPSCSGVETDAMIASIRNGTSPAVFCRPPEDKLVAVKPNIQDLLIATVAELPDEQILLSPETGENTSSEGPFGGGLSGGIRTAHMIARFSPEIPLGILLLVTLLVVRTPKSWLRWWGIPSFITGLLLVLVAIFSSVIFEKVWLTLLASRIPSSLSLGLAELVRGLANAIVRKLMAGILIGGLIVGLAGLGMWISSFLIHVDASSRSIPGQ